MAMTSLRSLADGIGMPRRGTEAGECSDTLHRYFYLSAYRSFKIVCWNICDARCVVLVIEWYFRCPHPALRRLAYPGAY